MSKSIYQILDDLGISYTEHTHPAVFTIEEGDKIGLDIPGLKTKNLFLRNRAGNTHYLVVVPGDKRIDLKGLAQQLNETNLSFASPERLLKYLGVTPGSVTPFALVNDTERAVKVILDQVVREAELQGFHPLVNTATLTLTTQDFLKFLDSLQYTVQVLKLY